MVGILVTSFLWDGLFSGAMLVSGSVSLCVSERRVLSEMRQSPRMPTMSKP